MDEAFFTVPSKDTSESLFVVYLQEGLIELNRERHKRTRVELHVHVREDKTSKLMMRMILLSFVS